MLLNIFLVSLFSLTSRVNAACVSGSMRCLSETTFGQCSNNVEYVMKCAPGTYCSSTGSGTIQCGSKPPGSSVTSTPTRTTSRTSTSSTTRSITSTISTTTRSTTTTTTTTTRSTTTTTTTTTTSVSPSPSTCPIYGYLTGKSGTCNPMNNSECCVAGKKYPQYQCSPPVTSTTKAILTVNGFGAGEDGGGASACDGKYHSNSEMIVALSTGWYNKGSRCGKQIKITANGRSVLAKVVDECDSMNGCDDEHAYQPPCINNDVDASDAVWAALGISPSDERYGYTDAVWSDV